METIMGYDATLVVSLLAVVFGVLILIAPKILNYLVGAYLIIVGVIGLWPQIQSATNSATTESTSTTGSAAEATPTEAPAAEAAPATTPAAATPSP